MPKKVMRQYAATAVSLTHASFLPSSLPSHILETSPTTNEANQLDQAVAYLINHAQWHSLLKSRRTSSSSSTFLSSTIPVSSSTTPLLDFLLALIRSLSMIVLNPPVAFVTGVALIPSAPIAICTQYGWPKPAFRGIRRSSNLMTFGYAGHIDSTLGVAWGAELEAVVDVDVGIGVVGGPKEPGPYGPPT